MHTVQSRFKELVALLDLFVMKGGETKHIGSKKKEKKKETGKKN